MVVYTKLNIDKTLYTDAERIIVTSSIGDNNASSSFRILFPNYNGKHKNDFSINDEVEIWAEKDVDPPTTKIITGIVEDIKFRGKGLDEKIEIKGRDYTARLMDSTVEPEVYNKQEVSVIVKDIIDKYVSDITYTNVATTSTIITHIAFNQIPVYDALKQLAELSNHIFWVDTSKDLYFRPKEETSSGEILDNTNITKSSFRQTDSELYNKVWVYGGRMLTGVTEEFSSITGSIVNLKYKPHNVEVIGGGSYTYQGGVYEMLVGTPISGTQYLVDYDQQRIVFVSGTYVGDNIPPGSYTIKYDRSTPIIKYGEDKQSIANYGPKIKVIQDKNIVDPQMARDMVVSTLNQYSEPAIQGDISLEGVVYLVAGNTVIVNMPNQNINSETYTILEARYEFNKKNCRSNQVLKVRISKKLKDMIDTIKQLMLDVKKLQAEDMNVTDVYSRMEFATGSVGARVSKWYIKERSIAGDALVWGHPTFGIWNSGLWRESTNISFVLGHPQAAILGTSKLGTQSSSWQVTKSGGTWT
ncbi:MAG: hypothetical protein ACTSXD_11920 [Candidatus Heimdallarchaeaceae archaeon]